MIEVENSAENTAIAGKLAEMSRHTSLTSLEAAIRLTQDGDSATAARRIVAVAEHLTAATEALRDSVAVARRCAADQDTSHRAAS